MDSVATSARGRSVPSPMSWPWPFGEPEILEVHIGAMAVEVHHVIRPPGRLAACSTSDSRFRLAGAGHQDPGPPSAPHHRAPAAELPTGTARPSPGPAGDHQQYPQPALLRLRQLLVACRAEMVRTNAPAPSATAASELVPQQLPRQPGPSPGRCQPPPARRGAVPDPFPDPRASAKHRAEEIDPRLRYFARHLRDDPVRPIPRSPPGTSESVPHPAHPWRSKDCLRFPLQLLRIPQHTRTWLLPPWPACRSVIRSSAIPHAPLYHP